MSKVCISVVIFVCKFTRNSAQEVFKFCNNKRTICSPMQTYPFNLKTLNQPLFESFANGYELSECKNRLCEEIQKKFAILSQFSYKCYKYIVNSCKDFHFGTVLVKVVGILSTDLVSSWRVDLSILAICIQSKAILLSCIPKNMVRNH